MSFHALSICLLELIVVCPRSFCLDFAPCTCSLAIARADEQYRTFFDTVLSDWSSNNDDGRDAIIDKYELLLSHKVKNTEMQVGTQAGRQARQPGT